ncbi:hypothetical protein COI76_14365 [Bacillus cereus]|uniref:hypothetical protein n=1 Tax=Bacillus sp. AW TaxID=2293329 RepID=UPI000BF40E89|nr:hypothetical protein COI76_14365 [Bacillus cereus]RFB74447.1 hypothetical protein DZB94_13590 [Bacillus sp. AW]
MAQDVQIYIGKPQTTKLPVYDVPEGQNKQVTIKQIIFNNAEETPQKVTVTVNTIDVMVATVDNGADVRNTFIVLKPGDKLSLKQEKENAVNVMICGTFEQISTIY